MGHAILAPAVAGLAAVLAIQGSASAQYTVPNFGAALGDGKPIKVERLRSELSAAGLGDVRLVVHESLPGHVIDLSDPSYDGDWILANTLETSAGAQIGAPGVIDYLGIVVDTSGRRPPKGRTGSGTPLEPTSVRSEDATSDDDAECMTEAEWILFAMALLLSGAFGVLLGAQVSRRSA